MSFFNRVSAICPYCKIHVNFSWISSDDNGGEIEDYSEDYFKNEKGIWVIGVCPSCKNCVLLNGYESSNKFILTKTYPFPLPSVVDERIPEKIKKDLEEAKLCFSVGAINASSGMCRKALQRACKEKGATKKELYDQIDEITTKGVISNDLRELAQSVRLIGNDGVHPNDDEVSKEDAEEILNLAEQFLDIIFVAPAKVKEIKERKEKK
ncbi:MAG: DUF4145 domain-containing protein [Nanoarchaeota archaeon]|nr:DUF4145 domain-containing protein [Nanoarchaeota archaeon]